MTLRLGRVGISTLPGARLGFRKVMKCGSGNSRTSAFTLVEILVTVGLILLIAVITVPLFESFRNRAKKAKCLTHLRTIHSGFTGYMTDHGHWPQMAEDEFDLTEEEYFGFWIEVTEPYGVSQDTWICPADRVFERMTTVQQEDYIGSYVVTRFDDMPPTPFRWNQPWAIERGDFHGKGAHVLMPDGSIQSANNPFYGR